MNVSCVEAFASIHVTPEDTMRVIKNNYNYTKYTGGLRSDSNGPILMGSIDGIQNGVTVTPFQLAYKVVKPYQRIDFNESLYFSSLITTDQTSFLLKKPYLSQVINELYNSSWEEELNRVYQSVDVEATNRAIESSLAYGDLLMLVSAVEAKATVRMIRNVFVTLFNALMGLYKSVKRLNIKATYQVLSDLWLEYRYGWRPLMGEVEALHKALTVVTPSGIKSAYGTSKQESSNEEVLIPLAVFLNPEDGYTYSYEVKISKFTDVTSKVGSNYLNTASSRNDDWLSILGVDINSLFSTAWELIPFSFIIDMFLNIGNILQTRNSTDQVSSFNSYKTNRVTAQIDTKLLSVEDKGTDGPIPFGSFANPDMAHRGTYNPRTLEDFSDIYTKMTSLSDGYPKVSYLEKRLGYRLFFYNTNERGNSVYLPHPADTIEKRPRNFKGTCFYEGSVEAMTLADMDNGPDLRYFTKMFNFEHPLEYVKSWVRNHCVDVTSDLVHIWNEYQGLREDIKTERDKHDQHSPEYIFHNERYFACYTKYQPLSHFSHPEQGQSKVFAFLQPSFSIPLTEDDKLAFSHSSPFELLNRSLSPSFKHEATADTELNTAQWVDIALIGQRLVSRLIK